MASLEKTAPKGAMISLWLSLRPLIPFLVHRCQAHSVRRLWCYPECARSSPRAALNPAAHHSLLFPTPRTAEEQQAAWALLPGIRAILAALAARGDPESLLPGLQHQGSAVLVLPPNCKQQLCYSSCPEQCRGHQLPPRCLQQHQDGVSLGGFAPSWPG